MSTTATVVMLFGILIVWGAILHGIRLALRRGAKEVERMASTDRTGPVTKHGHLVEVGRLWVPSNTQNRTHQYEFVEYRMRLPAPLGQLNLIEGEAFENRTNHLHPPVQLTRVGAPTTDDDVFNGVYDFTSPPDAATNAALDNAKLRRLLQDIHQAYGNLWVQDGVVRVFQSGAPDDDEIDINAELLTGIALQIEGLAP